ncbi:MAG: hypothetical protein AAGE86_07865 [Pseudomonadota bacterium]
MTIAAVFRRILLLALAGAQAFTNLFLFQGRFDPIDPEPVRSLADPSSIVPAGYAFAIWGVIFLYSLVFAVARFRDRDRGRAADSAHIEWLAIISFASCTLWALSVNLGPLWASQILILGITVPLCFALIRARAGRYSAALVAVPLGLYAGWGSVATFAGFIEILGEYGFGWLGLPPTLWTLGALLAAGFWTMWVLARSRYALAYAGAVCWGLLAIAVANVLREQAISMAILAGTLLVLTVISTALGLRAQRASLA